MSEKLDNKERKHREYMREYMREWSSKHKERVKELARESYIRNKEKKLEYARMHQEEKIEYNRKRRKTKMGRACYLLGSYKREDKKYNRGESDLTSKWIVENIFNKPCAHCGETDWTKIGCNRLDNSKPHTKDNVEPCCWECNLRLAGYEIKKIYQYTLDGKLIKIWNSASQCEKNGFHCGHILDCCRGKQQTHKGYKWSFNQM